MTTPLTFPALPGVLRRCSPVIVHDDGTMPSMDEPPDVRAVIAAGCPVGGWLVVLTEPPRTHAWSKEVPAWTLSLDISDPTGVDHLRDWLARRLLPTRGRKSPPTGSVFKYEKHWRIWRFHIYLGPHDGCEEFLFRCWGPARVPGLTAKLKPVEALRLCALHVAKEKGLLP